MDEIQIDTVYRECMKSDGLRLMIVKLVRSLMKICLCRAYTKMYH